MKPVLYVVRALPGAGWEPAAERFEIRGNGGPRPSPRWVEEAAGARALAVTFLDRIDGAVLDRLPTVTHLASYGVGVNHIDLPACRQRQVLVTNTPGVLTEATADHTLALLLAAARRVAEGDRVIRRGGWTENDPGFLLGTEVTGKTLGIVGFGQIGQAVARRAAGFRLRILYAAPREMGVAGAERVPLPRLLGESDFVALCCPLTDQTRDLVNRERLALMRPGSILVNTARGAVVDDAAVAEALRGGRLAAAGLDVFRDEPRVPEAYLGLDNVVLTPHLGSGSRETRAAMSRLVVEDLARVAAGEAPRHPVP
jgi:glyoxylate reductase